MARPRYKKPKDGVRYARVPSGVDTCDWCYMLAARGAVYYSETSAGKKGLHEAFHPGCNCSVVPMWGLNGLEGYDPEHYKERARAWYGQRDAAKDKTGEARALAEQVAAKIEQVKREPLSIDNMPAQFTEKNANRKKTEAFIDEINSASESDPKMLAIYNSMGKIAESTGYQFDVKYSASGHHISWRYSWRDARPYDVELKIPKMEGERLIAQAQTTAHELGHWIDHFTGSGTGSNFDDASTKRLWDVVTRLRISRRTAVTADMLPEKVRTISADLREKDRALHKEIRDAAKKQKAELLESYIDKYLPMHGGDRQKAELWARYDSDYIKQAKKIAKEAELREDYESRLLYGGWAQLEDIYDAMSNGRFRDIGAVSYGHGSKYYSTEASEASEIWANFCSLSLTEPKLLRYVEEDYPDLYRELTALRDELWSKYAK